MRKIRIALVAGARPNFMKIAPVLDAMRERPWALPSLIHTGQHYDDAMSRAFFQDLGIPEPDINLGVGSGSHAWQTGEIMKKIEPVLMKLKPDLLIVVGDVNSTLAASITAVKMGIKVAHVESGLRSFDRQMPEEINRLVTDAIADYLFTTEPSANENLAREGVPPERIFYTGNIMIDTLVRQMGKASSSSVLTRFDLLPKSYALLTLHRPSNVDDESSFRAIFSALYRLQKLLPIVFPTHPRTMQRIREMGFAQVLQELSDGSRWHNLSGDLKSPQRDNLGLFFQEPLGYHDFLKLTMESRLVLTDSGGIQEETTYLGIPCLTLRENSERPITLTMGTNVLVGKDPEMIVRESKKVLGFSTGGAVVPELWDGHTAQRILDVIARLFNIHS